MGFGVSVRIAPDVRLRSTSRGVRTSVGSRTAAPVQAGTGRAGLSSAGAGSSDTWSILYDLSVPTSGVEQARSPDGPTQPLLAQLSTQARKADKSEIIQEVLEAQRSLTTRHLVDFPVSQQALAAQPQPVDVDRIEQVFRRQAMANVGWFDRARRQAARMEARTAAGVVANERYEAALEEAERLDSANNARWNALSAHDRETVVAAVDDAFADHAPESTCVDAGTEPGSGRYVGCAVRFGHPDLVPNRVVAPNLVGRPSLKKRSRADVNDLYVAAMASSVLATVRQALAVAPAADEVRIVVLRNTPATAASPDAGIRVIYVGVFRRQKIDRVHWEAIDSEEELLRAGGAELVRKGAARTVVPLGVDAHRRMAAVLQAFSAPEVDEEEWVD